MSGGRRVLLGAAGAGLVLGLAAFGGYLLMEDPMANCHQIAPEDWDDTIRAYEDRGATPSPAAPWRDVVLVLEMPFSPTPRT